jgi:hypothetical protein
MQKVSVSGCNRNSGVRIGSLYVKMKLNNMIFDDLWSISLTSDVTTSALMVWITRQVANMSNCEQPPQISDYVPT